MTETATTAVGVYCNVCWETHDVHSVYVLPCGHGYCANVLEKQTRKPPQPSITLCPHCKQEFRSVTKRRLFLDLRVVEEGCTLTSPPLDSNYREESLSNAYPQRVHQQAERAAHGIDQLVAESPMDSVRRAAIEIKKVSERISDARSAQDCADKVQALLDSLSAFVTRITPMWGVQSQVATLRQQLTQRRNKITQLEEKNSHAERVAEAAVETAARLQQDCVKLRGEKETLHARLDKAEEDARERTSSINRLQDSVASYKKRDVKYMARIKELEAQLEQQREQIAVLEEASTVAAQEKFALESQLQMTQAVQPPDSASEPDTSDGFDEMYLDLDGLDDEPSSGPSYPMTSSSISRKSSLPAPPPRRPKFGSGWNLKSPSTGKRKRELDTSGAFPIARDAQGRALKPVALGPKLKLNRYN